MKTEKTVPVDPRPLLPRRSPVDASAEAVQELHRFHLAPSMPGGSSREHPTAGLVPALLSVLEGEQQTRDDPAVPAAGEQAPLHLLMEAARSRLLPAHVGFREEARGLLAKAEALLGADRPKHPEEGTDVASGSLGELGSRYLDPAALAEVLDPRHGGTALPERRRERLGGALTTLEEFLSEPRRPAVILVQDDSYGIPGCDTLAASEDADDVAAADVVAWRVETAEDPCAVAVEIFDEEAGRTARVLTAIRRIRLEAEDKYDPERQDPWLERFDWQAFSREELSLLPAVVAVVGAHRLARGLMASLSALLLSGRPVQVLVPVEPAADPGAPEGEEPLAGFRFEPAYLGLAHREALVQQTSSARPEHMAAGFARAARATHAGLHVVAVGASESSAAAALEARAHPLFLYDPEAGPSWAERLDFAHNPQPEEDWPVHQLEVRGESGEESLVLPFTFADFALLEPVYQHHFAVVPEGVPDADLVPVAEYADPGGEPAAIPFVWAVDGESRLCRLAVSRPLALACRDRLDYWRTLQELAGVRSEYVRRAEARTQREADERLKEQRERLEAEHARQLERLRHDATRDVVDRLTSALLEIDVAAFVEPSPAAGLASLAGRGVDDVASVLLEIADPGSLDAAGDAGAGDTGVEKLASELLRLVEEEPGSPE
ncbi:MAG: hypothetical protein GY719_16715 [bacterium]|nr:hypothetical protein [bacterium]